MTVMELTLDHATRDYFDAQFSKVNDRITENKVGVVKLSQELTDLKSNGYFVKPQDCARLHSTLLHDIGKIKWQLAIIVGGSIVLSFFVPYLMKHIWP